MEKAYFSSVYFINYINILTKLCLYGYIYLYMKEEVNWKETLSTKDFMEFPKELDKVCTRDEFHKIMTSHNSDIPIETVKFLSYPDIDAEQ